MSNEVKKIDVLDSAGLDTLLASLFKIIETNYARKIVLEEIIRDLEDRITAIEDGSIINGNYVFAIDADTGELLLITSTDVNVDLQIDENGDLILSYDESNMTPTDIAISKFAFNINENGELEVAG